MILQYLFAAIDARLARSKDDGTAPPPRGHHLNPDELKRLIIEASEAVVRPLSPL